MENGEWKMENEKCRKEAYSRNPGKANGQHIIIYNNIQHSERNVILNDNK
jgi:hypothetical protein